MDRNEVLAGRLFIGLLLALALVTQFVVIPGMASSYAHRYPEVAHLAVPYSTVFIAAIIAFELALLSAWMVASSTGHDASDRRWVNAATAAWCCALVIVAGVCVHAGAIADVGGPAMLFGLMLSCGLGIAALVLRPRVLQALHDRRRSSTSGADEPSAAARSRG